MPQPESGAVAIPSLTHVRSVGGPEERADDRKEHPARTGEEARSEEARRSDVLFGSTTTIGLAEIGPNTAIVAANDTYCQITGYRTDELRQMRVFDLSAAEDRERDRAELEAFLDGRIPLFRSVKRYRRKDGKLVWIDVSGITLYDDSRQAAKPVHLVQDVSDRVHAEHALHEALERHCLAKAAAGVGLLEWDVAADTVRCDASARALLGIGEVDTMTHEAFLRALHADDRQAAQAALLAALDPAGSRHLETQVRLSYDAGRPERWVILVGGAIPSEDKAFRVVGVARDITHLKRAELALWEREEQFRTLVEPFSQAVWEASAEGKALTDSPSWRLYTGQTLDEWMHDGWLNAVHPEDRDYAVRVWNDAVRSGTAVSTIFRLRGPNGAWRWTNVRSAPLRNPDGSIRKWMGMNVDVTDRVQAELARNESEAKYRALFEFMDEGFVLADLVFESEKPVDMLYVALNPSAVRILQADYTGRRLSELDPSPQLGTDWLEALGQVARTGNAARLRLHAEKLGAWLDCHAFRVGNEAVHRVGIVFEDVTARKQAEDRERAASVRDAFRVRLSDALRHVGDPFQMEREAAKLLCQHLGVARVAYKESQEEYAVVHVDYVQGIPSALGSYDMAQFGPALLENLRAGRAVVVSDIEAAPLIDNERAAYRASHVRAHITVPLMKDGQLLGFLSVQQPTPRAWTDEDVTLVKEVAERTWEAVERARAEQALEEKDRHLRTALLAARMGTWRWDVRTGTQVMDESFQQLIGLRSAGGITSFDQFLEKISPEDRPTVRNAFTVSVESGSGVNVEFRIRSNGGVRWLKEQGEVVRGADGRALYVTGACLDITDRKRSEEELHLAARRKDEFLAVLSHELRNPLAPIRNSVYILERATPGGPQATRAREVIDRQARHLTRIIDDLLEVTRIARGKINIKCERTDLNELMRKVAEDHRELFANDGVELVVEGTQSPLYAYVDATRIAQMIGNLLGNSAKFTPRGGRTTISLEADDQGNAWIRVRDNGLGISPETLNHLFEPFVQSNRTKEQSSRGLGLGLALVKGLAELHGGRVEARSEGLGKGADMRVALPLRGPPSAGPVVSTAEQVGTRPRVLVIEDDIDSADSLREVLEFGGHEVAVAYNGWDGLAEARRFKPNVILCDIGLPGMDGLAVARAIRADPDLAHVALFAVSGFTLPEDIGKAKEAGFDAHISKPATINALQSVLARAYDRDASAGHDPKTDSPG